MNKQLSALDRGFRASQVSEALANYQLADEPLTRPERRHDVQGIDDYFDDAAFWETVARTPTTRQYNIIEAAVSEWVARIPGLFWQEDSIHRRNVKPSDAENQIGNFITLTPLAKSRIVSGGIGTIRLPPSEDGYHLMTLTTSLNASAGVPVLISPDAWEHWRLGEGTVIRGQAVWQPMPLTWSRQFPSVAGVAKGCLAIRKPGDIGEIERATTAIEVHPFSVMEYTQHGEEQTQLYDFVYASAQTNRRHFHRGLEKFFEEYRKAKGRNGMYLTGADLIEPMWNSLFLNPEELRRDNTPALQVIEARITDAMEGRNTIEELLELLSTKDRTDLLRLSTSIKLPTNRWSKGGRVGDEAIRLVDAARGAEKLPALLYALQVESSI